MQTQPFGTVGGQTVEKYTLTNKYGTRAGILTLGGIVQEFSVSDGHTRKNLVVAFGRAEDYAENPFQINKQIGRVAGRIGGAAFELNGRTCRVEANERGNTLHGGSKGLGTRLFAVESADDTELVLRSVVREVEDGFPNDLDLRIFYRLDDENRLSIRYHAEALGDTVFDPTMHIYWQLAPNLAGASFRIPHGERAVLKDDNVPTGEFDANPLFDFSDGINLAEAVENLRKNNVKQGFDEAYRVRPDLAAPVAVLEHSDCRINIFSSRNGLVVFTASPADIPQHDAGVYNALATEPQTLPNSLNIPEFGNIRLNAGETHQSEMIFQVETL
ncbi:galactose mutarotase [Neisseria sp.]|uniref:aldose epimerase family protein n=1 Tax=Neisseria sp. TaxID=192066 RepID=UPI00359FA1B0